MQGAPALTHDRPRTKDGDVSRQTKDAFLASAARRISPQNTESAHEHDHRKSHLRSAGTSPCVARVRGREVAGELGQPGCSQTVGQVEGRSPATLRRGRQWHGGLANRRQRLQEGLNCHCGGHASAPGTGLLETQRKPQRLSFSRRPAADRGLRAAPEVPPMLDPSLGFSRRGAEAQRKKGNRRGQGASRGAGAAGTTAFHSKFNIHHSTLGGAAAPLRLRASARDRISAFHSSLGGAAAPPCLRASVPP